MKKLSDYDFVCEDCYCLCQFDRNGAVRFEEQVMPNHERYPVKIGNVCEVCWAKLKVKGNNERKQNV